MLGGSGRLTSLDRWSSRASRAWPMSVVFLMQLSGKYKLASYLSVSQALPSLVASALHRQPPVWLTWIAATLF